MKNINKKISMIGIFLIAWAVIATLLYSSFVSAVGVAAGFSAKMPMEAYPGEERVVLLTLQNTDVESDAIVEGKVLEGSDIASLDKERYTVPFKELSPAYLVVKIPENANIGDQYTIRYEFKHVGVEEKGVEGTGAAFSQGVVRSFNVIVVQKPAEPVVPEAPAKEIASSNAVWWWILGIVVLIIIVWIILRRKR